MYGETEEGNGGRIEQKKEESGKRRVMEGEKEAGREE